MLVVQDVCGVHRSPRRTRKPPDQRIGGRPAATIRELLTVSAGQLFDKLVNAVGAGAEVGVDICRGSEVARFMVADTPNQSVCSQRQVRSSGGSHGRYCARFPSRHSFVQLDVGAAGR